MFPDRTLDIKLHRENAYKALQSGDYDFARTSFWKWVESVRQQNANTNGAMQQELETAQKAYADFASRDPLFQKLLAVIIPLISEKPGRLQTELYKLIPAYSKEDISYVLYFAPEIGKITRAKKGRTYALFVL